MDTFNLGFAIILESVWREKVELMGINREWLAAHCWQGLECDGSLLLPDDVAGYIIKQVKHDCACA